MAVRVRRADHVNHLARAGLDHVAFQHAADAVLRAAIGYDDAVWGTVDPATLLVTSCTPIGDRPFDADRGRRVLEIEYLGGDPLTLDSLLARDRPAGALRMELGDLRESQRFREILAPMGVTDELRVALTVDGRCWGVLAACRGAGSDPFTHDDLEGFASVARTLAEGLRLAFLRAATEEVAGLEDPPGVATLDTSGRLVSCTRHAQPWLDSLAGRFDVDVLLASLAARIASHDEASALVVGSRGPVALHASRLKADEDDIAIVVERPRPLQLTPRIMEAHDLTPREAQVTELVLRGNTTAQISRAMGVTGYTVQDHLKSIFAKVGVQTRGELANELYVRHYLPPELAGATPSPYGYFLGV